MPMKLRNAALVIIAFAAATGMSYGVVRYLARDALHHAHIDPTALRETQLLRSYANELVDLMNEYIEHVGWGTPAPGPRAKSWIDEAFRPRLDALRLRLDEGVPLGIEPFAHLVQAADTLAAMAGHPADQHLRQRAASEVRRAAESVQAHIHQLGMEAHLPNPARKPLFGQPSP